MPPLALKLCEYVLAIVAAGTVPGVTVIAGAVEVKLYACTPEYGPLPVVESVTVIVKLKLPPDVGVPLIRPPVVSVTPDGSDPAVRWKLYGAVPPEALSCCE